MTTLRLYFLDRRIGEKYSRSVRNQREKVLRSFRRTAKSLATQVEKEVRADIKKASPAFRKSTRWAPGFHATVTEGGGHIRISATHDVPYFIVFARVGGTTIHGKPELAIPLSFAKDAQGVWARDFPGGLFRVDRPGKASLLLGGDPVEPKYFLKKKVKIPQKFKTIKIIRDIAKTAQAQYKREFKKTR